MYSSSPNTSFTQTIKDDDSGSDDVFPPSLQSQSYFSREGSMTTIEGSIVSHGDVRSSMGTTAISFQYDTSSGVTSANDESLDAIYFECRYPRAESTNSLACSIRSGSTGYPDPRGPPVELRPPTVPRRIPQTSTTTPLHQTPTSQNRFKRFLSYEPNRDRITQTHQLPVCRRFRSQTFDSHAKTLASRGQTFECRDNIFENRTSLIVLTESRSITALLNESLESTFRPTGTRPKKRWHCFRKKGPRYTKPKVRTKSSAWLLRRSTVWKLVVLSLVLSLASCALLMTVKFWADDSAWDNVGWAVDTLEICLPKTLYLFTAGATVDWIVRHNGNVTQCCTRNTSQVQDLLNRIIQGSISNKDCKNGTNDQVTISTKSNLTEEIPISSKGWYYVYSKVHFKESNCSQDIYTWASITTRRSDSRNTILSRLVKTCMARADNSSATRYIGGLYELDKDESVFMAWDSNSTIDRESSYIGTMKVVDL